MLVWQKQKRTHTHTDLGGALRDRAREERILRVTLPLASRLDIGCALWQRAHNLSPHTHPLSAVLVPCCRPKHYKLSLVCRYLGQISFYIRGFCTVESDPVSHRIPLESSGWISLNLIGSPHTSNAEMHRSFMRASFASHRHSVKAG